MERKSKCCGARAVIIHKERVGLNTEQVVYVCSECTLPCYVRDYSKSEMKRISKLKGKK
jgi:hypothetical protein